MDPNAVLAKLRAMIAEMHDTCNTGNYYAQRRWLIENGAEFVDTFTALDDWLASGGFPPADWIGESISDIIDGAHGIEV